MCAKKIDKDITLALKSGIQALDPIKNPFITWKNFSLYDSISAIQIDKENMDNFIHNSQPINILVNYKFNSISQIYKFTSDILIRIFQHLIKATSLSQSLFANRLKSSSEINSIIIASTRIVYVGSLLLTQNSSFLLHEDYFIESIDSQADYYDGIQEEELEKLLNLDLDTLSLKWSEESENLKIVFNFFYVYFRT